MEATDLKQGIFEMSSEEYHRHPAWGSSTVRKFASGTPKEFHYHRSQPNEPSDAMQLGTAIHTAILEPELMDDSVAVWTGGRRAGNAWKDFCAEHEGKVILTATQGEIMEAAAQAIQEAQTVYQFLALGDNERSYFAVDPETGLHLKTRPDNRSRIQGRRCLLDVKSIRDLSDRHIARSMFDLGYGAQAAFYCDVVALVEQEPCEDFFFLFVKNSLPVDIRFMQPDPEWIHAGRERNRKALHGLAECIEKDQWPGYPVRLETIDCPEWAQRKA